MLLQIAAKSLQHSTVVIIPLLLEYHEMSIELNARQKLRPTIEFHVPSKEKFDRTARLGKAYGSHNLSRLVARNGKAELILLIMSGKPICNHDTVGTGYKVSEIC